jgi:hypothetical protein
MGSEIVSSKIKSPVVPHVRIMPANGCLAPRNLSKPLQTVVLLWTWPPNETAPIGHDAARAPFRTKRRAATAPMELKTKNSVLLHGVARAQSR